MVNYRVISSDNHVFEPADLWTSRIEPRYSSRAPRIVRQEDGSDWWYCDGLQGAPVVAGSMAGLRFEDPGKLSFSDSVENVRPGGYIPGEHVKDQDIDGVDVSVIYPSAGLLLYSVPDGSFLTTLFRVYNDWMAEFCKPFPKRLKGIAMLNTDDVPSSVKELERCASMGLVGAMITVSPPEDRSYDLPEYEPLWAAAQALKMPLSLHSGTVRSVGQAFQGTDRVKAGTICNIDHYVRVSLANMVFAGVFERHPELQVGSVEQELSWAPHFLDRMDFLYTQRAQDFSPYRFKEDMLPSEYFHRNVFMGFQEDALGIRLRELIGVDNLMWGSDYPHHESTFPKSREILEEILKECSEEEKAKIAGGNAARVYRLE